MGVVRIKHKLEQYISCGGWEVAEMWGKEGRDGEEEDRVVPFEPDLVGPIPGQGVCLFFLCIVLRSC